MMRLPKFCFLCLQQKESLNFFVCKNCYYSLDEYKFYSCPRCTKVDCSGCGHLSEFTSIFCLYTYNNIFSKIIVNAKDKFNINFQKLFEELFFQNTKNMLSEIIAHNQYCGVILSPYRKSRIFNGYWHPNMFFERILNEILSNNIFPRFNIISTHYTSQKNTDVYWKKNFEIKDPKKILICDDVLTSGKSSQEACTALKKHIFSNNWDLFTIFRSPQK